ncbi:hypothetical protein IFM89_010502 [Coptis chinensis]|uniref:Uncharacterized protein n=1 Tax=Coptis chinensis TaxID=261450 RepID=A0A835LIE8_9MAGN|nr:hypothetical protein IFM89_010502 [Coptis chinensis]
MPSYTTWYCHGEPLKPIEANPERYKAFVNGENQGSVSGQTQGEQPRMPDLVNDTFGHIHLEDLDACMNELNSHDNLSTNHEEEDDHAQNNSREDMKAKKLRDDAIQPLYPSCSIEDTKLSVIVEKYESYQQTHPARRRGRKGKTVEKLLNFIPWLREQDPLVFRSRVNADAFRSTLVDEVVDEEINEGSWVD